MGYWWGGWVLFEISITNNIELHKPTPTDPPSTHVLMLNRRLAFRELEMVGHWLGI
jgi:hypothetical protein